jgi:hypothetical protein
MLHDMLRDRMDRHREDMEALLWSAIMLDYSGTEEAATRIASTPPLPRPRAGERPDPLGSLLPAQFYAYQDQLRARATRLAEAARAQDNAAIARAYGKVTETCVGCHAVYLGMDIH